MRAVLAAAAAAFAAKAAFILKRINATPTNATPPPIVPPTIAGTMLAVVVAQVASLIEPIAQADVHVQLVQTDALEREKVPMGQMV